MAKLNTDNFQVNNGEINLHDPEETKNYSSFYIQSQTIQKQKQKQKEYEFNIQKSNNLTSSISIQNQYNQKPKSRRKNFQKTKQIKKNSPSNLPQIKILSYIGHLQLMMKKKIMLCSSTTVYKKSKNYNNTSGKNKQPYYQFIAKIVCQGRQKNPSNDQIEHMYKYLKRNDQEQFKKFLTLTPKQQTHQVQTYKYLNYLENQANSPRGKEVVRRFNQKLEQNSCWSLFFQKFVEDFYRRKLA